MSGPAADADAVGMATRAAADAAWSALARDALTTGDAALAARCDADVDIDRLLA